MMTNARVQNVKRDMTDGDAAYLTGDGQAGRRAHKRRRVKRATVERESLFQTHNKDSIFRLKRLQDTYLSSIFDVL